MALYPSHRQIMTCAKDNVHDARKKIKTIVNDKTKKTEGSEKAVSNAAVQKFLQQKKDAELKKKQELKETREKLLRARIENHKGRVTKRIAETFHVPYDPNQKYGSFNADTRTYEYERKYRKKKQANDFIHDRPVSDHSLKKSTAASHVEQSIPEKKEKKKHRPPPPPQVDFRQLMNHAAQVKDKPVAIASHDEASLHNVIKKKKPNLVQGNGSLTTKPSMEIPKKKHKKKIDESLLRKDSPVAGTSFKVPKLSNHASTSSSRPSEPKPIERTVQKALPIDKPKSVIKRPGSPPGAHVQAKQARIPPQPQPSVKMKAHSSSSKAAKGGVSVDALFSHTAPKPLTNPVKKVAPRQTVASAPTPSEKAKNGTSKQKSHTDIPDKNLLEQALLSEDLKPETKRELMRFLSLKMGGSAGATEPTPKASGSGQSSKLAKKPNSEKVAYKADGVKSRPVSGGVPKPTVPPPAKQSSIYKQKPRQRDPHAYDPDDPPFLSELRRGPPPKARQKYYEEVPDILSDEEEEEDSDLDGFIDDSECTGATKRELEHTLKEVFGYDRKKYRHEREDDTRGMEASFNEVCKEEARSMKLGLLEDLEDIEREERMAKNMRKKK